METLNNTEWDIVISGTSLAQSLLALSLSRSGKRILHLDANEYYGGSEAAFSLSEAEEWAVKHSSPPTPSPSRFSNASITNPTPPSLPNPSSQPQLSSSRAYSLTLSPHLLYSRSRLIDTIVSTHLHNQLDFQAVGSWFVLNPRPAAFSLTRLVRVPSGREDVFADAALDLRAKRGLMKFLRFVANYQEEDGGGDEGRGNENAALEEGERNMKFTEFLDQKFGLKDEKVRAAVLALTMSDSAPAQTTTAFALPRIARHIRSIGVFGPGFGAVLPKWGGLAEIVQVACRACAVGGGVYVLGKAARSVLKKDAEDDGEGKIELELDDGGEKVTTTWLIGSEDDLPDTILDHDGAGTEKKANTLTTSRSISIVSSPLSTLFPATSEGGPIPAGAVIVVPSSNENEPPVHILAHTAEAGECPRDQCILYASTASTPAEPAFQRLEAAVKALLDSLIPHLTPPPARTPTQTDASQTESSEAEQTAQTSANPTQPNDGVPQVLWRLRYQQHAPIDTLHDQISRREGVLLLPQLPQDLVFDDGVLEGVKAVWEKVTGGSGGEFMVFEAREGIGMGDDGDE